MFFVLKYICAFLVVFAILLVITPMHTIKYAIPQGCVSLSPVDESCGPQSKGVLIYPVFYHGECSIWSQNNYCSTGEPFGDFDDLKRVPANQLTVVCLALLSAIAPLFI